MTKRLYVGNLPATISHDEIRTLFSQAGDVSEIKIARDQQTEVSQGKALIVMSTEAGQLEAIKRFNGYSIGEHTLSVRLARMRPDNLRSGRTRKTTGDSPDHR